MATKRKWTCSDGKTRNAGEGPWVALGNLNAFMAFCEANGHKTRVTHGIVTRHEVFLNGHWMSLLWNKAWQRYTADRRLTLIVQSFAAHLKGDPVAK